MARRARMSFLWGYARHHPACWVGGLVALLGTTGFAILIPWQVKRGIDVLASPDRTTMLPTIALWLVVFALLQAAFRLMSRVIVYHGAREVEFEIRNDLFRHLLSLPMSFYDRTPAGQVLSRAANDTSDVRLTLGSGFIQVLNTCFSFSAALVMMVVLSPELTLATIFLAPLLALSFRYLSQRNYVASRRVQEGLARLTARVTENLNGLATVQAHGQEEREIAGFESLDGRYLEDNLDLAFCRASTWPIAGALAGMATVIIIIYGGQLVLDGDLSLGDFVAFQGYVAMLQWPMIGFGWILNVIQRGLAAIDRLQTLLVIGSDVTSPPEPATLDRGLGRGIRIRDLSFAYPRRGLADLIEDDPEGHEPAKGSAPEEDAGDVDGIRAPVLSSLDLEVHPGETLALVGRIGAGKSALVDLLVRLYPVPDGTVLIDGKDVNHLDLKELRRLFGVVPQDRFLFSQTLRKNLLAGAPELTHDELVAHARVAQLDKDVQGFPDGYETMLGERGVTLSGGQRQRACLTRALAREPEVLILDDTFSAVDTDTEEEILRALRTRRGGTTTILITHRPSTMREADRICLLDHGRLVEQGTHEELLEQGGAYASLVATAALREELGLEPGAEGEA